MKKLIGVVSAVLFILLLSGSVFANELPMEETIGQDTQATPEVGAPSGEEPSSTDSSIPGELVGAEVPAGGEAPLAVWTTRDDEAPVAESAPGSMGIAQEEHSGGQEDQPAMPTNE